MQSTSNHKTKKNILYRRTFPVISNYIETPKADTLLNKDVVNVAVVLFNSPVM